MKTNVILAGLILFGICYLAGVPLLGLVFLGVAVVLFFLRNGGLSR